MLCPNFLTDVYERLTQKVRALLDKGVRPDDDKDEVCIFAVNGSVSVNIRLVCIAASLRL